ncbi:hypothetical protein IFT64_01190 [Oxalobacteraceae sp. CFBP 8753]|nr:hypothetical protein [Oxalobacteraceae sp. CFBP 8753]
MKKEVIKAAVAEFIKEGKYEDQMSFSFKDKPSEIYTVKFERRSLSISNESMKFEARSNTISALPSGARCDCCNGSGRS